MLAVVLSRMIKTKSLEQYHHYADQISSTDSAPFPTDIQSSSPSRAEQPAHGRVRWTLRLRLTSRTGWHEATVASGPFVL